MSFLDRFRRKDYDLNGNRFYQEYVINRDVVATSRHLKVTAALAAGLRIAEGVAAMPIIYGTKSVDEQGRTVKTPSFEGKIAERLQSEPNDYMTPVEFVENLTLHAVFEGVGRAYIDRGYRDNIKRLIPINNGEVTPHKDPETGRVTYQGTIPGIGFMEDMTRKDFIEVTSPRWFETEGLDISTEIREVLKLSLSLQDRQMDDSLKKAVRGYLTTDEQLSPEAVAQMKEGLKERLPGTPIFDSGTQYKSIVPTQAEMQLMESRRFAIEEVARAYGIHPIFLAHDAAGQSLTRILDAMDYHVTITLGPWVRRWEQAIKFSMLKPTEYVDLDETQFYRMNLKDRAEYASRALGAGGNAPWETPNDIRTWLGKNPTEGGDEMPVAAAPVAANEGTPDDA